jgi:hypothetical protein
MMLLRAVVVLSFWMLGATGLCDSTASVGQHSPDERPAWLYGDVPIWDLADEGLPFRVTAAFSSGRDPVSRVLFATEARWTFSVGYAKVYNSYDPTTGVFKNPGGHAALFSAGREFRWHVPPYLGRFTPKVVVEFGAHYATRRFPADGTRANFKLITGLEWSLPQDSPWTIAIVWPHFSNANLQNPNAGYDSLALRVGRQSRF